MNCLTVTVERAVVISWKLRAVVVRADTICAPPPVPASACMDRPNSHDILPLRYNNTSLIIFSCQEMPQMPNRKPVLQSSL